MGRNRTTWLARAAALAAGALLAGAAAQGSAYASDGNVDPQTTAAAPAGQEESNSTEGFQESGTHGQQESGTDGLLGGGEGADGPQDS
ncbi:hypothetical protein CLM62_43755 [Streptomyces sp. SA15]|uniref:hypothetical protein n=1 Tax=Streptomyces sp. SA15 TaxID=934019 RepID=UPI000BAF9884|nr:hypothetical protein [Streptomyces sp. SA15]PAZ09956.1 hypothetical protein CLM62_43755 [Streptomyces sp. SA15]